MGLSIFSCLGHLSIYSKASPVSHRSLELAGRKSNPPEANVLHEQVYFSFDVSHCIGSKWFLCVCVCAYVCVSVCLRYPLGGITLFHVICHFLLDSNHGMSHQYQLCC